MVQDPNGLRGLFREFEEGNIVSRLKGKGSESSDLSKIINVYRKWHLEHCPKLEYNFFLETVQKNY